MLNLLENLYPQERDQTADLLKGFAVLMMIQVHLMELFALPEIYQSSLAKISLFLGGPPAAPLFMAIMGYFLAKSKKSFFQNIKRGLTLIVGGVVLNIGLNLHLLILIFSGKLQLDPLRFILGADILPLAGLSIILISVIKELSKNNFYSNFIISILIIIFILVLHNLTADIIIESSPLIYLQAFLWGKLEWSYFPFLPWAVYPMAGFVYRGVIENMKIEEATKDFPALISAVVTFTTIEYGMSVSSNLSAYYHHDWIYSLWIFQFLILIVYVFNKLDKLIGKSTLFIYVKWLGKNVTPVYVFQWLIIGNIATAIYRTQNENQLVIWFIAIVLITSLLCFGYDKLTRSLNISSFQY